MRFPFSVAIRLVFAGLGLAATSTAQAAPAAPIFEQVNLFEVGQEGYVSYRIPCLVVTRSGTLLAFTSARKGVSDWADIDLMLRRSTDGGKTWEPRRIVTPTKKDQKAVM